MTQRVTPPAVPGREFPYTVSRALLPVEGWGSFRPGSRPAAVAFVMYRRSGEWHVPFVLRRQDLASHPGQVGLPGGGVEAGEEAWPAAARETEEEIGLAATALVPLGAAPPLYASVTNYSVVAFLACLREPDPRLTADPGELEGLLEVPLAALLDQSVWEDDPFIVTGRRLRFGGRVIWGLTARLLADLLPPVRTALAAGREC